MKNNKELFQKIKECEEYIMNSESKKSSLTSFLVKKTYLNKIYLDLLNKSYNHLFFLNVILLVLILLLLITQLFLSIFIVKKTTLVLYEGIAIGIIFILLILLKVKSIKTSQMYPFILAWLIFIVFSIGFIITIYIMKDIQQKPLARANLPYPYINKLYFYLISSHVVFTLFIQINMSLHYGHYFALFGIDILFIIVFNITTTFFYYVMLSMIPITLYSVVQSYKFEWSMKIIFDFCVRNYYGYLINEEIIQNANIGVVLTKEDFEIKKMSNVFSNDMKDLINNKKYFVYENEEGIRKQEKRKNDLSEISDSKQKIQKDRNDVSLAIKRENRNTISHILNTKEKKYVERRKRFLLINELVKKEYNKKVKINFLQALEKETKEYISKGKSDDLQYFHSLGEFQINKNNCLYNVKWKKIYTYSKKDVPCDNNKNEDTKTTTTCCILNNEINNALMTHLQYGVSNTNQVIKINSVEENPHFNYKFIFTEITKNRKLPRIKVEQIYQKLILAKISHEFSRPIQFIQTTMDSLLKEKTYQNIPFYVDEVGKSSPSIENQDIDLNADKVFKNDLKKIYLQVKYYAETITLSIMDLIEYINIHSASPPDGEAVLTLYPLQDIKDYMSNLISTYIELMEKPVVVHCMIDQALIGYSIQIEYMKINQIISNLLSNAIKNIDDNDEVFILINKMQPKDIKYFEFGANKDILIRNESAGHKQPSYTNEDYEVQLGIVIQIEDTGKGINSTLLKDINSGGEEFYRIDTNETKINNAEGYMRCKGLGSGLKICKKLADEMGIKLKCKVKNDPTNPGTIFYLYIKTELIDRKQSVVKEEEDVDSLCEYDKSDMILKIKSNDNILRVPH